MGCSLCDQSKKPKLTSLHIHSAYHATPSLRKKLALFSLTSGGHSVGIVRLRTTGHGVCALSVLSAEETFQLEQLLSTYSFDSCSLRRTLCQCAVTL
jgi:hypothetical protein